MFFGSPLAQSSILELKFGHPETQLQYSRAIQCMIRDLTQRWSDAGQSSSQGPSRESGQNILRLLERESS